MSKKKAKNENTGSVTAKPQIVSHAVQEKPIINENHPKEDKNLPKKESNEQLPVLGKPFFIIISKSI